MSASPDENRVLIFDTTLRDGEQSPGISLNTAEKLEIAQQLARLGVDIIEAGFPITSLGDFEAVQAIAREVEGPVVAGLARTHVADIDRAWEAVKDAAAPADPHVRVDLRHPHRPPAADDARGRARARRAPPWPTPRATSTTSSSRPMDATRADVDYTAEVCAVAIAEGATTINIPDTVGYAMPQEFAAYLARLTSWCPG